MTDTASSAREYRDVFAYKVTAMGFLAPEDRRHLIDHYADFCRAHVRHLVRESKDLAENQLRYGHSAAQAARLSSVMRHLRHQWELEIAWVEELRALETNAPAADKRARRGGRPVARRTRKTT
jgi:hypothetical protein